MILKGLSDTALMDSLRGVIGDERKAIVLSIECLLEITSRDLPARLGYPSLFAFLTGHCRLSESCASKRGSALGVVKRYPEVLAFLRDGKLHLSNLALVARHLTEETKDKMLQAACELSHRELEARIASLCLIPGPCREVVKRIALVRPSHEIQAIQTIESAPATGQNQGGAGPRSLFAPPVRSNIEIGIRVSVTLEGSAKEALDEIQRQFPGKSITQIVSEALLVHRDQTCQAKRLAPREKNARQVKKPLTASRRIPVSIKREVFARDGGRCSYVAPDGRRCDCTTRLEFDHRVPVAFGGRAIESNLRLVCRSHNLLYAKDAMGKPFIESHFTPPR
jgi:hypothetical protein